MAFHNSDETGVFIIKPDAFEDNITEGIKGLFEERDYRILGSAVVPISLSLGCEIYAADETEHADLHPRDLATTDDSPEASRRRRLAYGALSLVGDAEVVAINTGHDSWADTSRALQQVRGKSLDPPELRTVRGVYPYSGFDLFTSFSYWKGIEVSSKNRAHVPDSVIGSRILKSLI